MISSISITNMHKNTNFNIPRNFYDTRTEIILIFQDRIALDACREKEPEK